MVVVMFGLLLMMMEWQLSFERTSEVNLIAGGCNRPQFFPCRSLLPPQLHTLASAPEDFDSIVWDSSLATWPWRWTLT
jgi:hypothetical protein